MGAFCEWRIRKIKQPLSRRRRSHLGIFPRQDLSLAGGGSRPEGRTLRRQPFREIVKGILCQSGPRSKAIASEKTCRDPDVAAAADFERVP